LVKGPGGFYYGTTARGGQHGYGTIFAFGAGEQLTTVHHLDHDDGVYPESQLVAGTDGNLYGVTPAGGPHGGGVLFRVNLAPVVEAGGPYSLNEGGSVMLQASGADPQGEPLEYAWDLDGDGAFDDATGAATELVADDDGERQVAVRVADSTGLAATATATVLVSNVAPVVTISPAAREILPGASAAFTVTFADPGADAWSLHLDYGDGQSETRSASTPGALALEHVYVAPGPHDVTVTVSDDDGGSGQAVARVIVGSPESTIQSLIEEVEGLVADGTLRRGQGASLIAKLRLALWFLSFGNGEPVAAVMLDLFVAEVEYHLRTGVLSPEQGEPLAESAREIARWLRAP
jgi:uncharacterized repeat protein (TIGR03803 family)